MLADASRDALIVYPRPTAGDIVYCRFPEREVPSTPGPKPRPAIVMSVEEMDGGSIVKVVYGTTRHTNQLFGGEFLISPADGDAYKVAGLSYQTKFDFRNTFRLPYDSSWFRPPLTTPPKKTPVMGHVHPSLYRKMKAAYDAANNGG